MRLPRDLSGAQLAAALGRVDYVVDRQTGSHLRLTTNRGGEHHVTIPNHNPLKIGTLNAILKEIGAHLGLARADLLKALFG